MNWKDLCNTTQPKFELGQLLITKSVHRLVREGKVDYTTIVHRHVRGDWGDICDEDKRLNEDAVNKHCRIFSAYDFPFNHRVWVITEADRSSTTVLLPEEY